MIYIILFYPCKFLRKNVCPLRPNYQMIWQICPLCHMVVNVTFPAGEREGNKLWLSHGCWGCLCNCCVTVVWLLQWLRGIKEESGRHHARHEHSRKNRQKLIQKNSWVTKTLNKLTCTCMCTFVYNLSKTVNCAVFFQYSRSNVFETPLETTLFIRII